jgi:hypothetical protein
MENKKRRCCQKMASWEEIDHLTDRLKILTPSYASKYEQSFTAQLGKLHLHLLLFWPASWRGKEGNRVLEMNYRQVMTQLTQEARDGSTRLQRLPTVGCVSGSPQRWSIRGQCFTPTFDAVFWLNRESRSGGGKRLFRLRKDMNFSNNKGDAV